MGKNAGEETEKLAEMIRAAKRMVAFTGAGVSTESDIPDFRSSKGVYEAIERAYGRPAEVLLSHSFFESHPDIFFDYLRRFLLFPNARPNDAHKSLAALEAAGKLTGVITQNIDGLHALAGSRNVCELHGSLARCYCVRCGARYTLEYILSHEGTPHCEKCGGIVRPDVVLYEEMLDDAVTKSAVAEIERADLLLVMGTSLAVYPAASFITYFRGDAVAIINKAVTPYDGRARLLIHAPAGETMRAALQLLKIEL